MKKTILLALASLSLSLPATAQWGNHRVKGNGVETSEKRQVGSYDLISVSHVIKATLVPGSEGELLLEGEENLLQHIITEVSGNQLTLKAEKGYQLEPSRGSEGIRIRVPVTDLRALEVSGAAHISARDGFTFGDLEIDGSGAGEMDLAFSATHLEVEVSGACEITLRGSTESLEVRGSGASNLNAFDLQAQTAEARLSGAANVKISVSQSLEAEVSGAGDLRYRGNPEKLQSRASGGGSIHKS